MGDQDDVVPEEVDLVKASVAVVAEGLAVVNHWTKFGTLEMDNN